MKGNKGLEKRGGELKDWKVKQNKMKVLKIEWWCEQNIHRYNRCQESYN